MSYSILSHYNDEILSESFAKAQPFPHLIIDHFFKEEVAEALCDVFPNADEAFWYQYNNRIEIKLACNQIENLPPYILGILTKLNSDHYLKFFSQLTGITGLKSDPLMHGGGMHCIKPGGKLDVHIDYSIHPILKLERRLNLIVYLNKNWQADYGGYLELWEKDMSQCAKKILPIFNRAVIFATDDTSWHGHPEPLTSPLGICRKSLALYYLTEPRPATKERLRAQFVPRPHDPYDAELDKIRQLRSGNETAKDAYRV